MRQVRPAALVVGVLVAVELLVAVPLAIDLHRLSSAEGTARGYLRAAADHDCDRLVDLRLPSARAAGQQLAGGRTAWCRAQADLGQPGPVTRLAGDRVGVATRAGELTVQLRRRGGRWQVVTLEPCAVLPHAWASIEATCAGVEHG